MSSPALEVRLCKTPEDLSLAHAIRVTVFVDEQKFSMEDEFDEKDPASDHFVLFKDNAPIGTIRYFPPLGKLGRLAVLKEGRGVGAGRLLCNALEEQVVHRRGKAGVAHALDSRVTIVANSQEHAQGFYAKQGYTAEGELFLEDGEPHRRMVKTVTLLN